MTRRTSRKSRIANTTTPRLAALLGVLAALTAAAAAVARRRAGGDDASGSSGSSGSGSSGTSSERSEAGAPPADTPASEVVEETYTCECGAEYRVSGRDRHRVYWPADAEVKAPVLGQECPNCERPLPHGHDGGTSS